MFRVWRDVTAQWLTAPGASAPAPALRLDAWTAGLAAALAPAAREAAARTVTLTMAEAGVPGWEPRAAAPLTAQVERFSAFAGAAAARGQLHRVHRVLQAAGAVPWAEARDAVLGTFPERGDPRIESLAAWAVSAPSGAATWHAARWLRRRGHEWLVMWVSRRDDLVRPTHEAADGQVLDANTDDLFEVGGCQMRFPRDWETCDADEELYGCRCMTVAVAVVAEAGPFALIEDVFGGAPG